VVVLLRQRLGAGWTARVSNPGRRKKCFSPPKRPYRLCCHPASYYNGTGVHSRGKSGQGVKTTTYLHLAPRLRMSGAIPALHLYAFMADSTIKHIVVSYVKNTTILYNY